MKGAPMHVVLGAVLFFYRLGNELLEATLTYLEGEKAAMSIQDRDNLQSVGDGMRHSINSLKAMLEGLQTFPNSNSMSAFSSSPSKNKNKKSKATY
jgi:hypothetical protein